MVQLLRMNGNLSLDTCETNYFRAAMEDLYPRLHRIKATASKPPMIADPFARNCLIGHPHTNDIDPETRAEHHLDALDFLCSLDTGAFDAVLFDPPFSDNQARRYEHGTTNIYTSPGAIPLLMSEIERVLKPGGYLLKFGFNTSRHKGHFDLVRVLVVNHGGNHNDTLVSLWQKANHNLAAWS